MDVTQSSRFVSYRPVFKDQAVQKKFLDFLALEMGQIRCFERSVIKCLLMLLNIPGELRSHQACSSLVKGDSKRKLQI